MVTITFFWLAWKMWVCNYHCWAGRPSGWVYGMAKTWTLWFSWYMSNFAWWYYSLSWHCSSKVFQTLYDFNFAWGLPHHTRFGYLDLATNPEGRLGMSDVSPCLESQGCHLISLIFFLVLLPALIAHPVLSFSAYWPILLTFFKQILQLFSLRDELLFSSKEAIVDCSMLPYGVFAIMHLYNISLLKLFLSIPLKKKSSWIWYWWIRHKSTKIACPSLMCFFFFFLNKGNIWWTISSKTCVWCFVL